MKIERKTQWTIRGETDWCDVTLNIVTGEITVNSIRVANPAGVRDLASALKSVAAEIETMHISTAPALDLNGRPLAECNETNS